MTTEQKGVLLFGRTFNPAVVANPFKPKFITGEVWELCMKLIEEEWEELADATTIEERADAIGDLLYVVHFAANCSGIDIEPIQNEIQRSNMTKGWTDEEVRSSEYKEYYTSNLIPGVTGRRWVVRNDFDKVVKSPSYSPANIKPLIEAQINGTN